MPPTKSLKILLDKLQHLGSNIYINKTEIHINVNLQQVKFKKISSFLYVLLNKYEESYLIIIKGIPHCLMKDAADHLLHKKQPDIIYQKDSICSQCHYFKTCPGWVDDNRLNQRPTAVKHMPREIVFEVTNRCHLSCPICFRPNRKVDMPLEKIKSFINDCVRLGIKDVRFTGGEPLLYSHIKEAISYAKSKNRYVIVNTTATIMNPELKSILTKCADNLLISMQGYNPETNNRLTKANEGYETDFKAKLHNIVELNNLIGEVRLGTIISRTLVENFSKYHHLITSLRVKYWELYRGMSPDKTGDFNITPKILMDIMLRIHRSKSKRKDILIANPVPFCLVKDMNLSRDVLYGAQSDDGHTRLVVDVKGYLKPSYLISKNLGNTIEEAWNNPFLKKMKTVDYLPLECQECDSLGLCKGGSRYWSKLVYGTYYDKDPLMKYETNHL